MSSVPLVASVAVALIGGLAVRVWRSRREVERLRTRLESAAADLQNLRLAFSRFAPDEVIERVIADGLSEVGEKKDATALFADLVGFTALSESVEPTVLVRILNGYFERMSEAISEHRGYVSTFIGDGLLAFFGALPPIPVKGVAEPLSIHAVQGFEGGLKGTDGMGRPASTCWPESTRYLPLGSALALPMLCEMRVANFFWPDPIQVVQLHYGRQGEQGSRQARAPGGAGTAAPPARRC